MPDVWRVRQGVNPPAHVDLGGHRYTVRCDDDTAKLLREEEARGDSRPDRLLIRLDVDRPHTAVAETLLHETLHCAWSLTSLRQDDIDEEKVVAGLAPILLEALRRNPDLTAYLTAE